MPYIERDENDNIIGIYAAEQYDGQEYVEGDVELYKPHNLVIQEQINALESQQTPRRLREAALGVQESIDFLQDIDDQIEVLRGDL